MNLLNVLKEELIPALGCTEPIALAYASARTREILGEFPEKIIAKCSGNIIKNVKGVVVPGTKDMKGIETSCILGSIVGDSSKKLQLLTTVNDDDIVLLKEKLELGICEVRLAEGVENLFIEITAISGDNKAVVVIEESHTNIIEEKLNDQVIHSNEFKMSFDNAKSDFTLDDIFDFVDTVSLDALEPVLSRQIAYNSAISEEGLKGNYGANVGKTLLESFGDRIDIKAKAYAAAGSDARMSGSTLPVVINSGSGNQGITITMPILIYAEDLKVNKDTLYRALALGNLISIYIKRHIGKLSAFCGAVSAACGSGTGIAYLHGSNRKVIEHTIVNTLGNSAGIICDGAKASCAAKIATSVDAAILAFEMSRKNRVFPSEEGLIDYSIDQTIKNVTRMAKKGMQCTDVEILNIMIGN